ncbi:hypothetical protein L1987_38570 [Smallanthus sonchifolius]|uniref:Uncharacterized protein n=1 Tax=Smallanthus sonchifolius TaxID=185202 RepID=A0ACB9HKY8_9ASTR|nr:hypothetical protein L1987_38570 [Smallanthus sonchifolius]
MTSSTSQWCSCFGPARVNTCPAHGGICSVMGKFCLLEAKALPDLVKLLHGEVQATTYEAIQTLLTLVKKESPRRGAHVLHESGAVVPILEVLNWGSESLKLEDLEKMMQTMPTGARAEHEIYIPVDSLSNRTPLKPNPSLIAAASGNIKTVRIMVEKNRDLQIIAGAGGLMMPLYMAALYGNYEVVQYLYENSRELRDDGWNPQNRGWLLQKCVEGDMFDVALKIVKQYPELGSRRVLGNLARKPDALSGKKSNIIERCINSDIATSARLNNIKALTTTSWQPLAEKEKPGPDSNHNDLE